MDIIKLNAKLRVIETTFEVMGETQLHRTSMKLREELEQLLNWIYLVSDGSGNVHPHRLEQLKHYAVIYRENVIKQAEKFVTQLSKRNALQKVCNVQYLLDCFTNMQWLDANVEQYVSSTDLFSHSDYTTLYSHDVLTKDTILVGSLEQVENRLCNACDPIYEVTCRASDYKTHDGMFLISTRDVAETKRYK